MSINLAFGITMQLKYLLALILMLSFFKVSAGTVEDQIKIRQSAYSLMGWNTTKIKSQIIDHPETYNKDQVIAATEVIFAIANSGLLDLYGAGTHQGTGWKSTRLKLDYFQKQEEVKEIDARLVKASIELKTSANLGDLAVIKEQFGKLGAACKSCHDLIRIRD
jgi:cytochrome c556